MLIRYDEANAKSKLSELLEPSKVLKEINIFFEDNSFNSLLFLLEHDGVLQEVRYFVKLSKETESGKKNR